MHRVLFLIVLALCIQIPASAQLGVSFGIAASLASPTGDFADAAGSGIGGAALLKFGLLPIIDLTGSVDYISFAEKETGQIQTSASTWGINIGGRLNVLPMIFGGLEVGTYRLTPKVNGESQDSETKSAFAPIVGVQLGQLEGSVRYVVMKDANFFGARLGLWL
jgi:hypothetical protein